MDASCGEQGHGVSTAAFGRCRRVCAKHKPPHQLLHVTEVRRLGRQRPLFRRPVQRVHRQGVGQELQVRLEHRRRVEVPLVQQHHRADHEPDLRRPHRRPQGRRDVGQDGPGQVHDRPQLLLLPPPVLRQHKLRRERDNVRASADGACGLQSPPAQRRPEQLHVPQSHKVHTTRCHRL